MGETKNWNKKVVNLGTINEDTTYTIVFEALKDLNILSIESSCGCTTPIYNKNTKKLTLKYTSGSIPYHLKEVNEQHTEKFVTIYYTDGTHEILSFKAIIKKQ